MKKSTAFLLFVAGLATIVTSCSSDDDNDVAEEKDGKVFMTFTASQEPFGPVNRTTLSGTAVNWVDGDKIAVWDGTAWNDFNVHPNGEDATKATISGYATKGATSFVGVYPYDEDLVNTNASYNGGNISVVIPIEQQVQSGSFDPKAAVLVAKSVGTTFSFKNVCSLMKLTIPEGDNFSQIKIEGTGGIAGTISVNSEGIAAAPSNATISLQALSGAQLSNGDFYIAFCPNTLSQLTITCLYDNTATKVKTHNETIALTDRNVIWNMGSTKDWAAPGS